MWTDEKRVAVVRAGSPSELFADFLGHIAREVQRKRYHDERLHAEWVDVGGES